MNNKLPAGPLISDERLAEAFAEAFANKQGPGNTLHQLRDRRWRWKGLVDGVSVLAIIASQTRDYPNFVLPDPDWDAIDRANCDGRGDVFLIVMAKVTHSGALTYVAHIHVALARERLPQVQHRDGKFGSGFRLLPPNFCAADFSTSDEDEIF